MDIKKLFLESNLLEMPAIDNQYNVLSDKTVTDPKQYEQVYIIAKNLSKPIVKTNIVGLRNNLPYTIEVFKKATDINVYVHTGKELAGVANAHVHTTIPFPTIYEVFVYEQHQRNNIAEAIHKILINTFKGFISDTTLTTNSWKLLKKLSTGYFTYIIHADGSIQEVQDLHDGMAKDGSSEIMLTKEPFEQK